MKETNWLDRQADKGVAAAVRRHAAWLTKASPLWQAKDALPQTIPASGRLPRSLLLARLWIGKPATSSAAATSVLSVWVTLRQDPPSRTRFVLQENGRAEIAESSTSPAGLALLLTTASQDVIRANSVESSAARPNAVNAIASALSTLTPEQTGRSVESSAARPNAVNAIASALSTLTPEQTGRLATLIARQGGTSLGAT